MSAPGFLPLRQLVLVDLLGLMLAVRPGERAVIALDGEPGVGKSRLAAELVALSTHVAGRRLRTVSRDGHDPEAVWTSVILPFRSGPDPDAGEEDTLLLLEGTALRRPELQGAFDATALILGKAHALADAEYGEAQRRYRLQSRTWAPEWIVDNTDLSRPELVWPDPDEPQWFEQ